MTGKMTSGLIAIRLFQCLLCVILETTAQKKGFRGGAKSYEIHVEANPMGTNLHYKLPESKVKASSPADWLVDNDNAEMLLAINSPVLANVNVKHPKFSMKGQWPGYKTSFDVPKDVTVASKRHNFFKSIHKKPDNWKPNIMKDNTGASNGFQVSKEQEKVTKETTASIDAGGIRRRKLFARSNEILNMSRFLLPIAGMKNIDVKNPRVSKAMKGVIKHARKVVNEAKMVLNDAASFITRVRKLVKVTKHHKRPSGKEEKSTIVVKETGETSQEGLVKNATKIKDSLFQKENKKYERKTETWPKIGVLAQSQNTKGVKRKVIKKEQVTNRFKEMSKLSSNDSLKLGNGKDKQKEVRVKRRGLPETLESILYSINGLKHFLKYQ